MEFLLIGLGGFAGATCRYGFYLIEKKFLSTLPLATLAVNLLGCFLAGVFWGLIQKKILIHQDLKLILMVGFLGSFTTFSTFSLETVTLLRAGEFSIAAVNLFTQILLGLLLVYLGQVLVGLGDF